MSIGHRNLIAAGAAVALWSLAAVASAAPTPLRLAVLSSSPETVSGGDMLAQVSIGDARPADISVRLNGRPVTSSFRPDARSHALIGLLSGLSPGKNVLEARAAAGPVARLTVQNHPISGPILSGPHLQPFICQTQAFVLPDGSKFGPSIDADCSAPTKITYLYMPNQGATLRPLPSARALPADVAMTTTTAGLTVPFVVRVETTTINRGIHQNAVLFDPTADPTPTPFSPPKGWNRRLIAVHGVGCPGGWYLQGAAQGDVVLDPKRLGEGYALFTNTLRHPTNSCNALVAGETTMMDKEHVIETFGTPEFTVSKGSSGGAYTSLQVADAFPGLFDGVMIGSTFPDALSIALAGLDARLLAHYFAGATGLTEAQKVAITGYKSLGAFMDAAAQAQRADPVVRPADKDGYKGAVWNPAVPAELRYDPAANPRGARPTVFDVARNVYGVDPKTGFALRPFDNVGVQYGLSALKAGVISPAQFLDLNQKIGGYDQDANFTSARSVGDLGAISRAQQAGLALGGGGLASIPVFDTAVSFFMFDEDAGYHYQWFHFAVRERMRQANGDASNHVMWRGGVGRSEFQRMSPTIELTPVGKAVSEKVSTESWTAFIQWVAAATADPSADSRRIKTLRNRPPGLVDGCWTRDLEPKFIAEAQTLGRAPDTRCNALFPSYSFVRREAGGPLAANVYKCRLKSPVPGEYGDGFAAGDMRRLKSIFPGGVCDFARPGLGATGVIPKI